MTRRLSRHGLSCLLAWLLCASLYFWTAHGVSREYSDRNNAWHHYEYLVEGFLSGHLYVSRLPAPEILALADPYNPKANENYRMWDATLYQGKYYLYYGPTPALLLMLPWKVATGHHLPQWAATATFAVAGLGALALLLAGVARRYFPTARPVHLFVAVLLAGHVSWLPVILRRPAFWELPIVTAVALFWWCLLCLWRYHAAGRRAHWAFAAGVALACAPGARPTYAITVGFMILLFALPWDRTRPLTFHLRRLLPLLAPIACSALGLILYNYLRFGRIFEFGQSHQIWADDFRGMSLFSVANIPTNLWVYFLTVPEFSPYFPFFRTAWIEGVREGYLGTEEMPGLLFTMPALVLGFAALQYAWATRRVPAAALLRTLLIAGAVGGGITGVFLFCFGGGCSRYIAELLAGWSVVTGIGFLALFTAAPSGPRPGVPRYAAMALIAWTVAGVWLASFEFRNFFRVTQPGVYRAVATTLNYPSQWFAEATGQTFGPVALEIRLPEKFVPGDTVVLSAGRQEMLNKFVVERLAPNRVRLSVGFNKTSLLGTAVMAHEGTLVRVELHTPWLYPPRDHPYWNRFTDLAQRRRLQANTVIATSAGAIIGESNWFCDPAAFEPIVRTAATPSPGGAWIESMRRLDPEKSIAGSPLAERPAGVKPAGPARNY